MTWPASAGSPKRPTSARWASATCCSPAICRSPWSCPDREAWAPPGYCAGSHWALALEKYFSGERVSFALDVDAYAAAHGFTDFERDVYRALARVPYGEAVSYRDLAREAGRPNAYRAVGSAMARNALPVILPCHRVIKNDGRLGFYGDDPAWKERLLALEGVRVVEGRVT